MSSDNNTGVSGLDRIVKLWISLWNLVLENKRHYESVCTVLQRLVFESSGWPKYKNWRVICDIGQSNRLMMAVLATLDLSKEDDPVAQNIIAAFPGCFSTTEVQGPVPWSAMIAYTIDKSEHNEPDFMEVYGTISHFGLPKITLGDEEGSDFSFPDEDDFPYGKDTPIGTVVEFMGERFVVVENRLDGLCYSDPDMTLVPAECIALNL